MVRLDEPKLDPRSDARTPSHRTRIATVGAAVGLAVAVALTALAVTHRGAGPPGRPPASLGLAQDRAVPSAVLSAPLVGQDGRPTSLGALAGHIVVLTPFLTSCQETCPITTGAFLQMRRDVRAAGLARQVSFAEISIDPGRDTPSRMAAYASLTGATWPLLTGTPSHLATVWKFFGVYYHEVPEASPPGIDWQTGKPYTYDVDHSDGFIVLDGRGHVRFVTGAAPDLAPPRLAGALHAMLSAQGRRDLDQPAVGSWTVAQGLAVVGWVAGRAIPDVP